jgi:NAD+ synthase (glutamine-hydrolysing)
MKIALAQMNPTVGDLDGNARRILADIGAAERAGAHLIVFPELAAFGYPPKDLLHRRDLIKENVATVEAIARQCRNLTAIVGFVQPDPTGSGKGIFNAAAVCRDGRLFETYAKRLLPTYDVFDEARYFNCGQDVAVCDIAAGGETIRLGLSICEDLWNDHQFEGRRVYGIDPIEQTARAGASLLINLSASPYRVHKNQNREAIFAEQVATLGVPLVYVNQVGGNDDLVFDGASLVLDRSGRVIARAKAFEEDLLLVDLRQSEHRLEPYPDELESIHRGLVLGLRDYVRKCGFSQLILGLSGGIDSAVTAVLAVEAVDRENVHGVAMPSRFSSPHSIEDAQALADSLGIDLQILPIENLHRAFESAVEPVFRGLPPGVTEENIQARIRGNLLMALSNKFGWLLVTTGNKSELAVGYCTLYGDMSGGIGVLADVPKTVVYGLARRLNERPPFPSRVPDRPLIPLRTITKPPSAELRENQLDQDTLPRYDVLDAILERYVEQYRTPEEIISDGYDRETVLRVIRMVDRSEHKRKQMPIGLKVTSLAFGTGRRMPVAAKYH